MPALGEGRHEDYRDVTTALLSLQPSAGLIAVHPRHHDVQQNEVGADIIRTADGALTIFGNQNGEIESDQAIADHGQVVGIVVHSQNYRFASIRSASHPVFGDSYLFSTSFLPAPERPSQGVAAGAITRVVSTFHAVLSIAPTESSLKEEVNAMHIVPVAAGGGSCPSVGEADCSRCFQDLAHFRPGEEEPPCFYAMEAECGLGNCGAGFFTHGITC